MAGAERCPRYKVIVNWDGDDALAHAEAGMAKETFQEILFGGLEHTGVDCVFWNGNPGATALYPSKVLELMGESEGLSRATALPGVSGVAGVQRWRSIANAKAMIARGEDPNTSAIEGARQRGLGIWFSFRMNDQHGDPADIPQLKRDHPELTLGDGAPPWFATSYDYSHEAVRAHRLEMIREVAEGYDFDGIELDWQRHAHHLPIKEACERQTLVQIHLRRIPRQEFHPGLTEGLSEQTGCATHSRTS